jgi:DNA-binding response OmpR family regulator
VEIHPNCGEEEQAPLQRSVLVVDDDAALRMLCRVELEEAGFRVIEAADGDKALETIRADRPDVVLLDIMMPRVSGWQVAADLLSDRSTDAIPIIFISALTRNRERLRAFKVGAVGYLAKPFDPSTLAPTINELLDQVDRGERDAVIAESIEKLQAELARGSGDRPPSSGTSVR